MKKLLLFALSLVLIISCGPEEDDSPGTPVTADYIIAVDGSFIPQVRTSGIVTSNAAGQPEDMLTTLKNAGVNTIRLRLFKNPADGHSGFNDVKAFAQQIKGMGMKVWLTVHYSDSWADPAHQQKPAEWAGQSYAQLKTSVYNYTKQIVAEIAPDYIQIGNEINGGFIFPEGAYANISQFKGLLAEGCRAVRENSQARIMLHYAGHEAAIGFFSNFTDIDYDYIGLSYYPMWHGKSLTTLQANMAALFATYNKPVIIAETSYPFTFGYNDFTNNIIGSQDQILPQYPATPQGQKDFLSKIKEISIQHGLGFCYWGGEWISFNGPQATNGSTYENQALWDFDGKALPAMSIFAN
ncbi:MAG: glycoside hydrolase family 53 protein [Flavobacterium sp.]